VLDQQLGLGPRDEHAGIDDEIETKELAVSGDVRQGLAGNAASDQIAEAGQLLGGQWAIGLGQDRRPV